MGFWTDIVERVFGPTVDSEQEAAEARGMGARGYSPQAAVDEMKYWQQANAPEWGYLDPETDEAVYPARDGWTTPTLVDPAAQSIHDKTHDGALEKKYGPIQGYDGNVVKSEAGLRAGLDEAHARKDITEDEHRWGHGELDRQVAEAKAEQIYADYDGAMTRENTPAWYAYPDSGYEDTDDYMDDVVGGPTSRTYEDQLQQHVRDNPSLHNHERWGDWLGATVVDPDKAHEQAQAEDAARMEIEARGGIPHVDGNGDVAAAGDPVYPVYEGPPPWELTDKELDELDEQARVQADEQATVAEQAWADAAAKRDAYMATYRADDPHADWSAELYDDQVAEAKDNAEAAGVTRVADPVEAEWQARFDEYARIRDETGGDSEAVYDWEREQARANAALEDRSVDPYADDPREGIDPGDPVLDDEATAAADVAYDERRAEHPFDELGEQSEQEQRLSADLAEDAAEDRVRPDYSDDRNGGESTYEPPEQDYTPPAAPAPSHDAGRDRAVADLGVER